MATQQTSVQWPADPLAERRAALADGAAAVRAAIEEYAAAPARGAPG